MDQSEIDTALRLLQATRERGRRCYEAHKEERKAKRRAYYYAKKEQLAKQKEEAESGKSEAEVV